MKTAKKTRATFSDNTISVTLPKSWAELSQEELMTVLSCLALYDGPDDDPRLMIFLRICGISLAKGAGWDNNGRWKLIVPIQGNYHRVVWLSPGQMLSFLSELDWIYEPGNVPVRIESLHGCKAFNAKLRNLPFADYLKLENLYQAYLKTQAVAHIFTMEEILYPGIPHQYGIIKIRTLNILNWLSQAKGMFYAMFPNLFQKVGSDGSAPDMTEIMNSQIRALTEGDITKENEVLESDCWRALTELDYKAKEAEEHRRQLAKLKK